MGKLAKDAFYFDDNNLAFTASFSNSTTELGNGNYRLGEVATEFLNYNEALYEEVVNNLNIQIENNDIDGFLNSFQKIKELILSMPLYKYAINEYQFFEPEFMTEEFFPKEILEEMGSDKINNKKMLQYSKSFNELSRDIYIIKNSYSKFLNMMDAEIQPNKKDNRYAKNIEKSAIAPTMSGRSLGWLSEVDPADVEIRYTVGKSSVDGSVEVFEQILFQRLIDFVYIDFFKAMMQQNIPKKCKNCGAYFILEKGYKYEYCDHAILDNPNMTCRDVGASISYQEKISNNIIWKVHKRAYKKFYARVKKKQMTPLEFESWAKRSEKKRNELAEGKFSEEELLKIFNGLLD